MKEGSRSERAIASVNRHRPGLAGAGLAVAGAQSAFADHPIYAAVFGAASLGSVALDSANTVRRKHVYRSGEENFKSKELRGLELSGNDAADLLESYLGITFSEKPAHVVLTKRNASRFARKHPIEAASKKQTLNRGMSGVFSSEFNAYFTYENPSFLTSLHENMHSYINGSNFQFEENWQQRNRAKMEMNDHNASIDFNPEQYAVLSMVSEGVAEWAASYVYAEILKDRHTSPDKFKELNFHEGKDESSIATMLQEAEDLTFPKPSSLYFDMVRRNIAVTENVLSQRGRKTARLLAFDELTKHEDIGIYAIGLYFVDRVMKDLISTGMERSDALDQIIHHPPTSLAEIENPEAYLDTILGR